MTIAHQFLMDGTVKIDGNLDASEPRAGQIRQASLILPRGMGGRQIILRAELEVKGVRRPVSVDSPRTPTVL